MTIEDINRVRSYQKVSKCSDNREVTPSELLESSLIELQKGEVPRDSVLIVFASAIGLDGRVTYSIRRSNLGHVQYSYLLDVLKQEI